MKDRYKNVYFNIAKTIATLSYAKRLQVGAIAVKDNKIISIGFNGTPPGDPNICEEDLIDEEGSSRLITRPEVIHAEMNLLHKLSKSHESGQGASVFCTHAPCLECAKGILMSGIVAFYYENDYRSDEGLRFLRQRFVHVEKRGTTQ